ncbi:septal ring lytic transglycosylase RlpA family protein [Cohaesibacter haloalkalitolerans]|uniref:septal ring lytic transglycosylase RlpA family protein n=1 Tax=Cohaesibacter haloalkalitolerans TaxID=1162980 RepID=UPI003CCAD565
MTTKVREELLNRIAATGIGLVAAVLFMMVLKDVSHAADMKHCGTASWYQLTSRTASGEMANPKKMTAAHKSLELGQKIEVTNMRNGKKVIVRVNDRGPFIKGRILDVTRAAASELGFKDAGTTKVCFKRLS